MKIAPYSSCIINCIFWRPSDPRLLSNEDALQLQDPLRAPKISPVYRTQELNSEGCPRLPHRLIAVADISADPEGSIQFMTDCTSIDVPFTMYDAYTGTSSPGVKSPGFLICSIDNLPAQMPRDATDFFGAQLMPYMKDIAIIASNGKLTPSFEFIQQMRRQREKEGAMFTKSGKKYKVLVLGSGFVSKPVLEYLTRKNDTAVTLASDQIPDIVGNDGDIDPVLLDIMEERERLESLIKGHDIVVSAVDAGICIAMEFGLDPGIDHMLAVQCFDEIRSKGGEISSFVSWCGGLPAPENSNNPLHYKFSWSPAGVLKVTLTPSRYLLNGEFVERAAGGENYRKPTHEVNGFPVFNLEGIPNRDSTKYASAYNIEKAHTILRGTLRYKGFANAIVGLQQLGLMDTEKKDFLAPDAPDLTWRQLIPKLLGNDGIPDCDVQAFVYDQVDQEISRLKTITDLGLLSDEPVAKVDTPMMALEDVLKRKLAYGPDERDMIIMRHEIIGTYDDRTEQHNITLVAYGDPDKHSAMSLSVGYPCAAITRMILAGKLQNKGVVTPLNSPSYNHVLGKLSQMGLRATREIITQKH